MAEIKKTTVTVDRKTYAITLSWSPAASRDAAIKAAKETAGRLGLNLLTIHSSVDGSYEYALGSTDRGHTPGMEALASTIVSGKSGSWAAILDLPDSGFYLVVSRNGAIEPQSDLVFETIDDAYSAALEISEITADFPLYAHPRHQIPDARDWTVSQAIREGKSNARMRDVNGSAKARRYAVALALSLFGATGLWYAYGWLTYTPPPQAAMREEHIPPEPWINRQVADEEIGDCLAAFDRLPLSGSGWKKASTVCQNGVAVAAYTHDKPLESGGTPVSWFRSAVAAAGWPARGVGVSADAKTVTYTLPLPRERTIWRAGTQPLPVAVATSQIIRQMDERLITATADKPVGKYYIVSKIRLHTAGRPTAAISALAGVPGLVLDQMQQTASGYDFTISVAEVGVRPKNVKIIIDAITDNLRPALGDDFGDFYAQHKKSGDF